MTMPHLVSLNWLARHDENTDPSEIKVIPTPDTDAIKEKETTATKGAGTLALFLWRMSEADNLSLIALRRVDNPGMEVTYISGPPNPIAAPAYGQTLKKALERLQTNPIIPLEHKWHSGVLLLRNPIEPFLSPVTLFMNPLAGYSQP